MNEQRKKDFIAFFKKTFSFDFKSKYDILRFSRWMNLLLIIVFYFLSSKVKGTLLPVCSILFWVFVISFIVISVLISKMKRKQLQGKSY